MPIFTTNDVSSTNRLVWSSPAQVSHTSGASDPEFTLNTGTVAAGHGITAGSVIVVNYAATMTNNANTKTFKLKLGSTLVYNASVASVASWQKEFLIVCRSTSSQVFWMTNNTGTYTTSTATTLGTGTEDISGAFTLTATITLATAADTWASEYIFARILNP